MQRLLQSIAMQTFKDYEIIITDDSPDESVKQIVDSFSELPISYVKNDHSLGTPANWNRSVSMAKGEWIKLMHDDDWFANEQSLQKFADKAEQGKAFIFSGYETVFQSGERKTAHFPPFWRKRIIENPVTLLSTNVIGTPSVTLVSKRIHEAYDERMKWRVDIDYYIRMLKQERDFALIDEPLIRVGMSEEQVTNSCLNVPDVELPEGLLLLEKHGVRAVRNIKVYDAWWRILRNTGVRKKEQLWQFAPGGHWPVVILKMVTHQSLVPSRVLKIGLLSKAMMFLSWLTYNTET